MGCHVSFQTRGSEVEPVCIFLTTFFSNLSHSLICLCVCLFLLHVVTCSKLFYCCVVSSVLAVLKLGSPRSEDEKSSERNGVEYCKHKPCLDFNVSSINLKQSVFQHWRGRGYKVRFYFQNQIQENERRMLEIWGGSRVIRLIRQ